MKKSLAVRIFMDIKRKEINGNIYEYFYVRPFLKPILFIVAIVSGILGSILESLKFFKQELVETLESSKLVYTETPYHKVKVTNTTGKTLRN